MPPERVRVVTASPLPQTFPESAFEGRIDLETARTDDALRTAVRDAEVLYSWAVPPIVPAETPRLRWIQLPSAGSDQLRGHPVWSSDVQITASQGVHAEPMAEHFFAMLLALVRRLPDLVRAQDRHEWLLDRRTAPLRLGELRGRTLGIIGWGKIGQAIAHLAGSFGMRVIGTRWSVLVPREVQRAAALTYADPPWLEPVEAPPDIVYPAAQLHDVLSESDAVVLLLPLTPQTEGSFGAAEFAAMRRGALFFNLGRGAVVVEAALVQALQSSHLGGAGLDVFEQEPLPRSSPLWGMQHVIISPHLGGVGNHTRDRAARLFAVNLTRYLEGRELLNIVDRRQGY